MNQIQSITPVVSIINQTVITTSLDVARVFEKRHDHVLRSIEQLKSECGADFTAPNFGVSEYQDETGRKLPAYNLTRDGFTLLAMGFTGKKALQFKLAYIAQFNAMESSLQQPALPAPSTITKEQIGIIYQTLCAKYPNGDNRHAAWSRFNKYFNLNEYKSLPASRFDEALTWIGGVEVKAVTHSTEANEPALHKLPLQTMLTNERYLTYIDSDGTLTARPLASNDFVANMGNLAKRILNDLAFGSSDEDLMSIMDACKHTITQRIEAQERKLGNLKRLIA